MNRVEINETLIEFDGVARIERGPKRIVAVATEELLLSGKLASHYQVGSFDAYSKPIVLGEEMTYYDWLGEHGWYVYRLEPMPPEVVEARGVEPGDWWVEKGFSMDWAEAEALAVSLV